MNESPTTPKEIEQNLPIGWMLYSASFRHHAGKIKNQGWHSALMGIFYGKKIFVEGEHPNYFSHAMEDAKSNIPLEYIHDAA